MAIALKTLSRRLTGTRPGFASPQKTAPLTEPVQSPNATLYERDGWLAVSVYPPPRTNIGVDQQRGQVTVMVYLFDFFESSASFHLLWRCEKLVHEPAQLHAHIGPGS